MVNSAYIVKSTPLTIGLHQNSASWFSLPGFYLRLEQSAEDLSIIGYGNL